LEQNLDQFLTPIFKESFLPIIILSPEGKILACSNSFCQMTGFSKSGIYDGKHLIDITPESWHKTDIEIMEAVKKTRLPKHYRKEFLSHDGRHIPVEACLNQVTKENGSPTYFYLIVTEWKGSDTANFPAGAGSTNGVALSDADKIKILRKELKSSDPYTRVRAAADLGKFSKDGVFGLLAEALKDPVKEVRMNACLSLGDIADRKAAPLLVDMLRDHSSNVRWGAVRALGKLGDKSTAQALTSALKDPDVDVRRESRDSLRLLQADKK
jgi:PAS domain S-box-containing protein